MSKTAQISLQGIHAGEFKGEGIEYGNVMAIPGALNAKMTVSESTDPFHCDDGEEIDAAVEKIELEIETAGLALEERAFLLGERVVNGSIASNINDVATRPYIGMTFKSQKRGGEWRYVSIPKIKFSLPDDEFSTKTGKIEGKSTKLIGKAVALSSGVFRVIADSDAVGVNSEFLEAFLETIPQTTAPAPTNIKTNK